MNQSAAVCSVEGLTSWPGSIYVLATTVPNMDTEFFDAQHYKLRPSGPHGSGAYFHARLNPKPCTSTVELTNYEGVKKRWTIGGHSYSYHYDSGNLYRGHIWAFGSTVYMFICVTDSRTGKVVTYDLKSCTWWLTPGQDSTSYYLMTSDKTFRHSGDYPGLDSKDFDQEDNYLEMFDEMMNHPPRNITDPDNQTGDLYSGRYVDPSNYEKDAMNGYGLHMPSISKSLRYFYQLSSCITVIPPQRPCFAYKLNERNVFDMMCDFNVYLAPYASGLETAYLEAAKTLPSVSGNSIANVMELVQGIYAIVSLIKGRPRKLKTTNVLKPSDIKDFKVATKGFEDSIGGIGSFLKQFKDPRDAWLYGRYTINTTECDISEYTELIARCVRLDAMCSETIQAYGQFQSGSITYRATMTITLADLVPKDLSAALRKAGFGMTLSNVWDMIPYSFVVDWFIGVSDVINWAESIGNMLELKPSDIWYSCTTKYNGQVTYFRVPGIFINNIPALVTNDTSGKTIVMRICDSISLFTK